jgi:hypothetical protein
VTVLVAIEQAGHWCWRAAGDLARLLGGLGYWNARKTLFLLGWSRKNPCQNVSDEGAPGSMRCTACVHWREPGRLRHVCPDLMRRDDEWRCARGRDQVRPYWGRLLPWWLGFLIILHPLLSTAVWGFFRTTTAPDLAWTQVAWPGRWEQIRPARARYFTGMALRAFAEGRMGDAMLALSTARQMQPEDYAVRLLRAQFAMYERNIWHADAEFESLWAEHPDRRGHTAIAYHDTLVATMRMEALARHSLNMVARDPDHAGLWIRSLLHGLHWGSQHEVFWDEAAEALAALPPHARTLVRAELLWRMNDRALARILLRQPHREAVTPFYALHQVKLVASKLDVASARVLLQHYLATLSPFDQALIQLELALLEGSEPEARALGRSLFMLADNADRVDRLLATIIQHNNRELWQALDQHLHERPALAAQVSGPAMWVAGIACGVPEEAGVWRERGRHLAGDHLPNIRRLDFTTLDYTRPESLPAVINVTTLPREVIFALQRRMPAHVFDPR